MHNTLPHLEEALTSFPNIEALQLLVSDIADLEVQSWTRIIFVLSDTTALS